jgi:hypothetical protein
MEGKEGFFGEEAERQLETILIDGGVRSSVILGDYCWD